MQLSNYEIIKDIYNKIEWNKKEINNFYIWRANKEENDTQKSKYHLLDNNQIKVFKKI